MSSGGSGSGSNLAGEDAVLAGARPPSPSIEALAPKLCTAHALPGFESFGGVSPFHPIEDQGQWVAETLERRLAEIANDPLLTGDGKRDAKKTAGEEALRELGKWRDPIMGGFNKHEEVLVAEIRTKTVRLPPADPGERMERALLRQEIRAQARGLDQIGRELFYRAGNQTVRDALDETPLVTVNNDVPRVESYVTPEVRDEVAFAVAEVELPEQAAMLSDLRANARLSNTS